MHVEIPQNKKRFSEKDQAYFDMLDTRDNYAILMNELCKNVTTVQENIKEERKCATFVERFLLWKQSRSLQDSSLSVLEIKQYTKSTEL